MSTGDVEPQPSVASEKVEKAEFLARKFGLSHLSAGEYGKLALLIDFVRYESDLTLEAFQMKDIIRASNWRVG